MKKLIVLFTAWSVAVPAPAGNPIRGFTAESAEAQRALEEKARAIPDPVRLRSYMEHMSAEPHIAGTPQSRKVAEYALGLLKEWGLDARIEEFEALLPFPTVRLVEMTAPVRYRAKLEEPKLAEDKASRSGAQIPTYNSYAASGDVTAELVYVNYGIPEDYEELKKRGIDVRGRIVIARYGKSWRGTKAKVAHEQGAVGCLIYSDPREDGYFAGDVYPKGPYRPQFGVQRGSVLDMPLYPGDPLSPGWASEKGAKKLTLQESDALMKIPVLPISYGDAQPLLAALNGSVAPEPWRGALPITYHIGPGPATVRLKLDFDWTTKPLYNVIATIPGKDDPEQWVLYGNHHDAWNNGAMDPVSGAVVVLETGRTLARLVSDGWRPRRTIKLALWDAEEFGLVGSTEWVEKHKDELRNSPLYLNTDTNGTGTLSAGGSPSLEIFLSQVLRDTRQPGAETSVLENRPIRDGKPVPFRLAPLGAGSDYVAFIHHAGVPSINAGFGGEVGTGGIYHSVYDSFEWYTHFSDRDFLHGRALAQVYTAALLRMAEASILPFEYTAVVRSVEEWMKDLPKLDLTEVVSEVQALKSAAAKFESKYTASSANAKQVNAAILAAERALLADSGLEGRPWYRNHLMAPGVYTGYSAKTLPAIRDSKDPQSGVKQVAEALRRYRAGIERAASLF
jgi:N-acetylated-alpha-linked acidic dipeptidase